MYADSVLQFFLVINQLELETIKNEIKLRNFDLAIDDEVGQLV